MNKYLKISILLFVVCLHFAFILFFSITSSKNTLTEQVLPDFIRLINIEHNRDTLIPEGEYISLNEAIAENIIYNNTSRDINEFIAEHFVFQNNFLNDFELTDQKNLSILESINTEENIYYEPSLLTDYPILPLESISSNIVYPHMARQQNIEGRSVVALYIDENGNIVNIDLILENPQGWGFGSAVINAFTGIKAQYPALINGRAVPVRLEIPIDFRLN